MNESKQLESRALRFITEDDALGLGRIVVNERFYGLPVAAVREFQTLRAELEALKLENANLRGELKAKGHGPYGGLMKVENCGGPYPTGVADQTDSLDLTSPSFQKQIVALMPPLFPLTDK